MLKQRSLLGYIGLSIITCGIYSMYWIYVTTDSLNKICQGDQKETNPGLAVVLSLFTFGIYPLIWYYQQGERMKAAGLVRKVPITDSGATYLLWILLGGLLCGIGALVAMAKFIKNYNTFVVLYNNSIMQNAQ